MHGRRIREYQKGENKRGLLLLVERVEDDRIMGEISRRIEAQWRTRS